jgi:hypothetical protein
MSKMKVTRRAAFTAAALLPLAPAPGAGQLAVSGLRLPPQLESDLRSRAEAAIQEAKWLEELPLENVDPGFVFIPRSRSTGNV